MLAKSLAGSLVDSGGKPFTEGGAFGRSSLPSVLTYLSDTFTDTNGTALTAHTMTIGPGWVGFGSQFFDIQSNATREQFGNTGSVVADAGVANGVYRVTVSAANCNIVLRLTDNSNRITLTNPANTQLTLTKTVAGADTVIVSDAGLTVITYPVQLQIVLSGDNITCSVVGQAGQQIAGSDSFNNTATRFGFRAQTALITYDDFSFKSA